ncbi:MAG: hypothetical protein NWR99_08785 [Verrucomicrobiales bacterium]|nr:hypothetical protein [Verrucomicrobiales bacterium]
MDIPVHLGRPCPSTTRGNYALIPLPPFHRSGNFPSLLTICVS